MDNLFNRGSVIANLTDDPVGVPCQGVQTLDDIPIAWEHNYNRGKTTIFIDYPKKLSKFEEDAISGYVMAQCYPELFENWLQQFFGQK